MAMHIYPWVSPSEHNVMSEGGKCLRLSLSSGSLAGVELRNCPLDTHLTAAYLDMGRARRVVRSQLHRHII